ncbi:hypothetical protein Cni_G19437 [Canna indica]|uniref:Uncharacterized protein n=1 Tax=Canna indica TaxID=4628 RepID=A0AAQ3QIM1_9LILI|nr:hypothetical protein Cni_G19437 [Canna indica]
MILRILSDMRTLSADLMANTRKADPELRSLHQENEETKQVAFFPRPVAPTAAQNVFNTKWIGYAIFSADPQHDHCGPLF